MPLASLAALQWYGPACAALVADPGVGDMPNATPVQTVRAAVAALGTGDAPLLRPYRMRDAGCSGDGLGVLHAARPVQRVRAGLEVLVSALSSDDVTGAVLEAPVEGDLNLKQAIRLLLAHAAGNATGLDGNPAFKSLDGSKTRVAGTISGGTRTITTRDGASPCGPAAGSAGGPATGSAMKSLAAGPSLRLRCLLLAPGLLSSRLS